jgi:putative membrane protein (TIGR04086 family)
VTGEPLVTPEFDWSAVGKGGLLALAVAVPAILAHEVIDAVAGLDPDSDLVLLFYVAVLAGLVLGGRLAGLRRPDAPFTHGALAALSAYAVLALVTTVVRLADGEAVEPVGLLFNAFMAASAGILGGLLATRRTAGPRPEAAHE